MSRHKKYDVVKSIRIGLSQLEKIWLESHSSQSELINSLIRKEMSVTKTLNPKIQEIVARAIARLSVEGIELNYVASKQLFRSVSEVNIVCHTPGKSRIIVEEGNIIFLGKENELDGRGFHGWYLVDIKNPIAIAVWRSALNEDDEVFLRDVSSIPEWMLAGMALEKPDTFSE
jgi:hypothetical protein